MGFFMSDGERYPQKMGEVSESIPGEDILARIATKSAYFVELHTKSKVEVFVNGNEVVGDYSREREEFVYSAKHITQDTCGRCGGIRSLVIQGTTKFFLEYGIMNNRNS